MGQMSPRSHWRTRLQLWMADLDLLAAAPGGCELDDKVGHFKDLEELYNIVY